MFVLKNNFKTIQKGYKKKRKLCAVEGDKIQKKKLCPIVGRLAGPITPVRSGVITVCDRRSDGGRQGPAAPRIIAV